MKQIFCSFAILIILAGCVPVAPSPTSAVTPSATATQTATPLPSSTPLPTATATPIPTPTATPLPPLPFSSGQTVLQPGQALSPVNASVARELARWGNGRAESISLSPDGTRLFVQTPMGVYLYDAEKPSAATFYEGTATFSPDGNLLAVVQGSDGAELTVVAAFSGPGRSPAQTYLQKANHPSFSPDSNFLALTTPERVILLESRTGKQVFAFEHKGVDQMVFSADGTLLLSGARDSLVIWQTKTGSQVKRMDYNRLVRLAFSADGNLLLAQNRSRQNELIVDIWSVKEWALLGTIKTSGTFTLAPDASRLFVSTNFPTPGKIEVFQLPDGKPLAGMRAEGSIYRMAVAPDGKTLAVSVPNAELGVVALFDIATGKQRIALICEHACDAQTPHFSPDGKILALYGHIPMPGGDVGAVILYEAASGKLLRRLVSPRDVKSMVEKITFTKDSNRIAVLTGRSDDAVRIWEVNSGKLLSTIEWAPQTLNLGGMAPDGKLAAVFSDNPSTLLVQTADGKTARRIEKAGLPQFSADGSLVAAVEYANNHPDSIRLWRVSNGEAAGTFARQVRPPLVLSPSGDLGAVLNGFSIQLLRIPSGAFVTAVTATTRPNVKLLTACFSPDGKILAAGDEGGLVWGWQVESRKQLFVNEGHKKEISALTFNADGKTLVSLSKDGGVRFWQAEDGKLMRSVNSAELLNRQPGMEESTFGLATGVALSPDGKLLAVGGFLNPQMSPPHKAGVTLLVEVETGKLLHLLRSGGEKVFYSPDGKLLYTSGDGAVRVWGVLP